MFPFTPAMGPCRSCREQALFCIATSIGVRLHACKPCRPAIADTCQCRRRVPSGREQGWTLMPGLRASPFASETRTAGESMRARGNSQSTWARKPEGTLGVLMTLSAAALRCRGGTVSSTGCWKVPEILAQPTRLAQPPEVADRSVQTAGSGEIAVIRPAAVRTLQPRRAARDAGSCRRCSSAARCGTPRFLAACSRSGVRAHAP